MSKIFFGIFIFGFSIAVQASPTLKYNGVIEIGVSAPHNEGVKGQVKVFFDEVNITQIVLQTTKPIYGKSEFSSTEQKAFTRAIEGGAQLAMAFKLKGPPHKWYYVFVGETFDQGVNYKGKILKASATMEQIANVLEAGTVPVEWTEEGSMTLVQALTQ